MNKKTEKALNEKLNVKLPDELSKDNILLQLENVQQNEKIVEMPKKKNTAKRLVPIAASLALVVGILGIYFGAGLGDKLKTEENISDKTEVMRYQSYDKIYDKFDELRKEYKKNNVELFGDIGGIFNSVNDYAYADDAVAENMAGDMNTGSLTSGDMLPEDSDEELWGESVMTETTDDDVASGSVSRPSTENRDDVIDEESAEEKNHGTTNTQETGVDEGDIIKTDGDYLYIANGSSKSVSIVDVTGEEMVEVSRIDVDQAEIVKEIYINSDKMIILGSVYPDGTDFEVMDDGFVLIKTYGYTQYNTFVKVYDIGDRTEPKLVTEYSQQGGYDSSRMIGTKLYCVSTYYVDITAEDYRDLCIPETEINGVCKKIEADCISVVEESNSTTYAVITTLDVANGTEPTSEAVLGNCEELYASAKGLFLSETDYDSNTGEEFTKIYRFEYTDTGVDYKCMGKVAGYINDQFSMSYDGEYFRIATTVNKTTILDDVVSWSTDNRVNNLYILNNNMQIVGKVEDLAKGESIESVRFVGDMAYVVTFRQTDPLFVIDLSDPENPTVKGELKIPGFSEYLHPIADGLLIGVGNDGTETGTNGDCKVSLFDVSDPYNPTESSVVTVSDGDAYCHTGVAYNHKLYINLSATEFAVPFNVRWFVRNGEEGRERGIYYIRYKLENNKLCEVARYYIDGEDSDVMGATYVENIFYVVTHNYDDGTFLIAYDLTTNEEIGRIKTAG